MTSRAGKKATQADLCNVPQLVSNYFQLKPRAETANHRVEFGTSGHRGCAFDQSFNEEHILAITQAIVEVREKLDIQGPIFVGKDTHALSEPAYSSVLEVLIGNGIQVITQANHGYTPTPGISHAILAFNRENRLQADGIVITPSHNPPQDGGIKYNPPHGGPGEEEITKAIETRANQLIAEGLNAVRRVALDQALNSALLTEKDLVSPYVEDLTQVIDMAAIQNANLKIGVDPLGGSGIEYWQAIKTNYGLNIEIVNDAVDPTFRFMSLDKDEVIRMDCSSPSAMASLLTYKANLIWHLGMILILIGTALSRLMD